MKWFFLLLFFLEMHLHPAAQSVAQEALPAQHKAPEKIPLLLLKWNARALAPAGEGNMGDQPFYLPYGFPLAETVPGVDVAIELRVTPRLTLDAGLWVLSGAATPEVSFYQTLQPKTTWSQFYVESRWYGCPAVPAATAPFGPYVGLRFGSARGSNPDFTLVQDGLPEQEWRLSAQIGLQRRFPWGGYINFSYGLGWRDAVEVVPPAGSVEPAEHHRGLFIRPALKAGLALGPPPGPRLLQQEAPRLRPRPWRIGLLGLFDWNASNSLRMELPVAYEYRLGRSSWSAALEGWVRFSKKTQNFEPVPQSANAVKQVDGGAKLEIRHFPGLARREAAGQTAGIPTGFYWGIQGRWVRAQMSGNGLPRVADAGKLVFKNSALLLAPMVGVQVQLFGHFYLNYQSGMGSARTIESIESNAVYGGYYKHTDKKAHWFSDLRVGVFF